MLTVYVMDQPSTWEDYLHIVDFACKNVFRASLNMSLFEALYDRKCNTLVSWDIPIDKVVIKP